MGGGGGGGLFSHDTGPGRARAQPKFVLLMCAQVLVLLAQWLSVEQVPGQYQRPGYSTVRFIQIQTKRRKRANEMPALFWSLHIFIMPLLAIFYLAVALMLLY